MAISFVNLDISQLQSGSMNISINVDLSQFDSSLDDIQGSALDLSGVFGDIGVVTRDNYERTFLSEGPGWAPLAPSTIARKQRLGFGDRLILERTGELRRSFVDEGAPGNFTDIQSDEASFGSQLERASELTVRRRIPQVTDQLLSDVERIVVQHVEESI